MDLSNIIYVNFIGFIHLMKTKIRFINKLKILISQTRFTFKLFFVNPFFKIKSETFLGFKVYFFNYEFFYYLFSEIFFKNEYYFFNSEKSPTILDCGSNIGLATIYFKWIYPNCLVSCFEPDPLTFKILKKNIKKNKFNNIELINAALSDKNGFIDFYINPKKQGSLTMSTFKGRINGDKISVRKENLSKYVKAVDLLKMDIEGSELEVMEELNKEGKLKNIKEIIIEYHHNMPKSKLIFSNLLKILEANKFHYQISSSYFPIYRKNKFQDILIYAYSKK